jgi:hypothetical protein
VSAVFDLLIQRMVMGGWQLVAGMATPLHVPDEATLAAALCSISSDVSATRCLLQ